MKHRQKLLSLAMLTVLLAIVSVVALVPVRAATTLTSRVQVVVSGSLTNTLDLVTASAPLSQRATIDFASGVAASQADVIWSDTRSLATATTEDLDLVGGALTDAFGVAFAPAKVKAVYVKASSSNTTNLTLLGDANSVPLLNTAATTVTLQPGGVFLLIEPPLAGIAVTAGTGDIIQIANAAGATASYDIVIIGTSS